MKNIYKLSIAFLTAIFVYNQEIKSQSICNPEGNLFIFSNYDGGILNINVDLDIPNLKFGIVSYEAVEVNFTGDYVSNITSVTYAGFNAADDNCGIGVTASSFSGIDSSLTEILFYPQGTIIEDGGNDNIICGYYCGPGNSQGCNTANEILNYFTTTIGGALNSYTTQYNCWDSDYSLLATLGNCCEEFQSPPTAEISILSASICVGDCIDYNDLSGNLPTSWNWSFEGANTDSSELQNPTGICYLTEGTFTTSLSVENEFGSDNATIEITVGDAEVGNAEITEVGNTLVASPDGLNYQWYNCGGSLTEIIGATAQNFTPFANGLYAVIVSNNGCRDTSNCVGFAITTINELSLSDGISIYPIPFADGFYIDGALLGIKGNDIELLNALGQIVFSKKLNGDKTFIKTENLATGIYFLEVKSVNTSRMYKLIKE